MTSRTCAIDAIMGFSRSIYRNRTIDSIREHSLQFEQFPQHLPTEIIVHSLICESFRRFGVSLGSPWNEVWNCRLGLLLGRFAEVLCDGWFLPNLHRMVDRDLRDFSDVTRFVVLLRRVAWAQLFPVPSPYGTMRNDLDVEASGTL
jgi:hypothetical protein